MFILTVAGIAYAQGSAGAGYGAAHHLDLTREITTHDGTRIMSLVDGVKIGPASAQSPECPLLSDNGLTLMDGERLPVLCDVIVGDDDCAMLVATQPRPSGRNSGVAA